MWVGGPVVIGAVSESEEQRSIPTLAINFSIFCWGRGGGGGRGLPGGPVQRNVTYRRLLTPFPHRKLPLYQPFTVLQDAHGIYLALNKDCPRSHLHPWNNATLMTIMGITVYATFIFSFHICEIQAVPTSGSNKFYILLLWWQSTLSTKLQTMWHKQGCHGEGSCQEEKKVEGDKNGGISGHGRPWCHSKHHEKTHSWTPQTPRSDTLRPARLLWTHKGEGDNGESPLVVLEFSAFSALRSQWS